VVKAQKGAERREQERRDVELDVDLSTYGKYHLSRLKNISVGGAFILARKLETVGTEVRVKFSLPGQIETIEALGRVAWTYTQEGTREPNSTGMGIQFSDLKEEDRARIGRFIESSSRK
jgi:uncharacterized protein (TIGR02266 family)